MCFYFVTNILNLVLTQLFTNCFNLQLFTEYFLIKSCVLQLNDVSQYKNAFQTQFTTMRPVCLYRYISAHQPIYCFIFLFYHAFNSICFDISSGKHLWHFALNSYWFCSFQANPLWSAFNIYVTRSHDRTVFTFATVKIHLNVYV